MTEHRPDPEALLARAMEEEARKSQGRLKLFFGAAAGVGKTFAMLEAAQELKADGVDVVVGYAETHCRAETEALLEGLEVLPAAPPPLPRHRPQGVQPRRGPGAPACRHPRG
jgi:two-component system sensor histidine kinase KdpD